ncbi:copper chaperone PCu(A)C [Roseibium salinum]|nr:copper chaperone PCu(A)C [Roseibium salinum]
MPPGGLHIMLTGAAKVLKPGDRVTVTLAFGSGQQLDVEVKVARPGDMPSHSHGPMNIN